MCPKPRPHRSTNPQRSARRRWQDYEQQVYAAFRDWYPDAEIIMDAKVNGRYSKTKRQVDVLIRADVAGFPITIAVEAKYLSRKINVKDVESFESMMRDIDVNQGLLITEAGFSRAAINRARHGDLKLELDILSLEELKQYQSSGGIPYSGRYGVVVTAPFGWVLDISQRGPYSACLCRRGMSIADAQEKWPWMYLKIWHTADDPISSIDSLLEQQNSNLASWYEGLDISSHQPPRRRDGRKTHIRVAKWAGLAGKEVTGFVDFDEFIVFIVLFTSDDFAHRNIQKLAYTLKHLSPGTLQFDNTRAIASLEKECEAETSAEAKAVCHYRIAHLYREMEDAENVLKHRRLCWQYNSTHYDNAIQLITNELDAGHPANAQECALDLFSCAPTNPRVMQDFLHIYCSGDKFVDAFHRLVRRLCSQYRDEALANIMYHYGIYFANQDDYETCKKYLTTAKDIFVTCDRREVVQQIDEVLLTMRRHKNGDPMKRPRWSFVRTD